MNILYIGYWSVTDGLSEASIQPGLRALNDLEHVKKIIYVSIERGHEEVDFTWGLEKVKHYPYYSSPKSFLRDKISDLTQMPKWLAGLCNVHAIDKILCRSSPAGAIGYLVHKKTGIDYIVESFEPHAEYMRESGVWSYLDVRYWIQRYFEKSQKKSASHLITVSENYRQHLLQSEKIKRPVSVIPCAVSLEKFKFNHEKRKQIRTKLNLSKDAIVGIYVGKFGDIYYDEEAFEFFKICGKQFKDFFLLILSPEKPHVLEQKFRLIDFPKDKCWYGKVPHEEVSHYLSAADFSFCFHRPHSFSFAYSPIKNGEYWANGLPVLISQNIGDDSDIIFREGGGLIVNYKKTSGQRINDKLLKIIKDSTQRRTHNQSVKNAVSYRNAKIVQEVYSQML